MNRTSKWSSQIGRDIVQCRDEPPSIWHVYDFAAVPKPRMTQRDKWMRRPCVILYREFKDRCIDADIKLYDAMEIVFYIEMPKSWSAKKKRSFVGKPHQQRPDVDNLTKGLLDILEEDSSIHRLDVRKIWAETPSFKIRKIS